MRLFQMDGLTYKIGAHGYVYKKLYGAWIRSSKTSAQLRRATEI